MKQHVTTNPTKINFLVLFFLLLFTGFGLKAATYTVTSAVNGTTVDGVSLRWAITQANSGTGNTIAFNIPGIAPRTISLTAALPILSQNNTIIDGTTQPANGFVGVSPKIIISCSANTYDGLGISGDNCQVYGLYIKGGSNGIEVTGDAVIIGSATKRNVISGNTGSSGIYVHKTSLHGVTIKGNYIGVDTTGTIAQGNGNAVSEHGIDISATGVDDAIIGGSLAGEGNIVSANAGRGINIDPGTQTGTIMLGNYVGVDKTGLIDLGNGDDGIYLTGLDNMSVGGSGTYEHNVVAGNNGYGIYVGGNNTYIIKGNFIGTNALGTAMIGNSNTGLYLSGNSVTTIGGGGANEGNVISGNGGGGLIISGTTATTTIKGNKIGTDITGTVDLGNSGNGLDLSSTSNTATVGGTTIAERNIISCNSGDGVFFSGTSPQWTFYNNYIGVDATGTVDFGNDGDGIEVGAGTTNTVTIGGSAAGQGNIISGNGANGLKFAGYTTPVYTVRGNKIGTDITGTQNLGNGNYGIFLNGAGAKDAQIGGVAAGQPNVIAYNGYEGIRVEAGDQNDINRNSIFCNSQVSGIGGIILTNNGNNNIAAPVINTATITTGFVQGTAPANSLVEIFSNDVCCEGKTYVASVTASAGGAWSYTGALSGSINATANLAADGTSQLGNCVATCTAPVPGIAGTVTICNGVSTTLTASGGTTYSWNTGATTTAITVTPGATTTYTVTAVNGCGSVAKTQIVTVNSIPAAGITGTTTICNGAGTTLTGTGGGTYLWNTGPATTAITISPSANTTYTVTVTSGSGCTAKAIQAVTVNSVPTTSMSSTNATCGGSNGTATVTATGTATLVYLWSPGGQTTPTATGLTSGSYNVTVTDGNGCTKNASVSVNNATGPTATLSSQTNVLCNGSGTGSATVTGSGGTGTLTYSWSPGGQTSTTINGLTAGTYICTVTDANGCAQGQSVTITQPVTAVSSGISSQSNVNCTGAATGNATITATGGTGALTYSWSPGGQTTVTVTGLTTGTYNVTITDGNGCTKVQSVSITQPASVLGSTISGQSNVNCTGSATGTATVTGTGGTPSYTYSWSPGGNTTAVVTGLTAGTYSVTITDNNGCTKVQSVAITQPLSVLGSSISSQNNVKCTGNATASATITGTGGTPAYTYSWIPGGNTTAAVTGLTAGTYIVTITDNKGCTKQQIVDVTEPVSVIGTSISSQNDVGCTGAATGTATVTGTGGTPSYTYSWSPGGQTSAGVSGLTSGTYTVTVTDANGCTAVQTVAIAQPASVISSGISSQNNVGCRGNATGSATVTTTGGTPTYTYLWNSGQTTATISGLTAGTYSVTITDANGCTKQQSATITQPATVIGSSIGGQSNVGCTGAATGTATVTGTGGTPSYTYSWSPGGQTTAGVTGLTSGTYNVTITDANGCTTVQTVSITQPVSVLSSSILGQSNVGCTGAATGTATVTGSGGTPSYTYSWSPGGQTTAGVSGLTSGTYNVTVMDANGCTKQQSIVISQPVSVLGSSITGQSNVGCTGSATGTASVSGTGGTPSYTYSWSPGGQTTAGVSGLTSGTYNVTLTDANGCTTVQTVSITQPLLSVNSTTGSVNATCGNSNGSATVTATGGTPGYTYSWSPIGGTGSAATNLPAGPYNVTITDNNGCTKMAAVSVNNSGAPTVSIDGQTNVLCNGAGTGSATITAVGGTGALTYLWSPGGQTTTSVSGLTAGTYIVTVTDANNCAQGQTITITQPVTAINAGISSQMNVGCTGSATGSATITATGGTGTLVYSWLPAGQTTTTISGLTAGTYSVTVTDANGCSQQQQITIIEPALVLSFGISSQNNVNCTGSATGSAIVTAGGGTPNYTYNWSTGETTNTSSGLTAGTYSVIVIDANGCSGQQVVSITQPASSVTLTQDSTNAACGSSNGTVSVTASGGTPGYTYNWSTGETTANLTGLTVGTYSVMITDNNGCTQNTTVTVNGSPGPSISGTSATNITCNGLNNGTATVTTTSGTAPYSYTWTPVGTTTNIASNLPPATYTVIVSDSAGCMDTTVFTITEPLPMTFSVTVSNATICAGESLTLLTTTPAGGTAPFTFNWLPNGPVVSPLVPTTYSVSVTDSSGCISQLDTIRVTPLPSPTANFDTLSTGIFGQDYVFTDLSTGSTNWYWDFGDGTTSILQNPNHKFPQAGIYTVTQIVTNTSGCPDTITKIVIIHPNILIPNVFTPNHDGINDEFWIPNTGFESFELTIYDRWGLKLFVTDQGEIRWDGRTSAGNEVPDGTYYYLLNAILKTETTGKKYVAKGFIDLHRSGGK